MSEDKLAMELVRIFDKLQSHGELPNLYLPVHPAWADWLTGKTDIFPLDKSNA